MWKNILIAINNWLLPSHGAALTPRENTISSRLDGWFCFPALLGGDGSKRIETYSYLLHYSYNHPSTVQEQSASSEPLYFMLEQSSVRGSPEHRFDRCIITVDLVSAPACYYYYYYHHGRYHPSLILYILYFSFSYLRLLTSLHYGDFASPDLRYTLFLTSAALSGPCRQPFKPFLGHAIPGPSLRWCAEDYGSNTIVL